MIKPAEKCRYKNKRTANKICWP